MIVLGLVVVVAALAALVAMDGAPSIVGLPPEDFASLAAATALLSVISAGFWRRASGQMTETVRAMLIWAALGTACVIGYAYRDEAARVGDRVMAELRPGSAVPGPDGAVTISRRGDGDFAVRATVEGRVQTFLFDTGASAVVLSAENTAALGLKPAPADFTVRVATANGTALAAPILIDSLGVGTIVERRVQALVVKPGALRGNLLGQTFLSRLASYEVRGDKLILRPKR